MATDPTAMFGALLGTLQQTGNIGRNAAQFADQQQANKQRLALGALQLAGAQAEQQQAAQYQQDVQSYYADPTLDRLSALAAKYPKQAAALKQSFDIMNESQKQSTLTQFGSLYNAADNGKVDLVKSQLGQIKTAEQKQGVDTGDIDQAIRALDTDPESAMRYIKGFAQIHLSAAGVDKFQLNADNFTSTGDGAIYNKNTGQIVRQAPQYKIVKNADGSESIVSLGGGDQASGGGGASQSPGAPLDPRQFFKDFVLPHEGGYAAHDANGAPVNFGINQSANPEVDVSKLTPEKAADIFTNKYWAASGSADLPPALAAVNADTAYINPKRAQQFLKASGGDPQKYLAMRRTWMANLVAKQPDTYQKYAKAWDNRNNDLAKYMQQVGGGDAATPDGVKILYTSKGNPGGVSGSAPSGYRFKPDGTLEAIPGGPSDSDILDQATLMTMAQQYLAGDKSVLQNLGRGRQGAANVVKLRAEIARQATAAGMNGRDVAAQLADFTGVVAGERAAGTRIANIELAATEAQKVIPLALSASEALPRTGFLPFSRAQQAIRSGNNDPRLRRFVAANTALVNVYSRAISPAGVPTVSDKEHARNVLDTAYDQASYRAVVRQMQAEIEAARAAPQSVRRELGKAVGGPNQRPNISGFRIVAINGKPVQ